MTTARVSAGSRAFRTEWTVAFVVGEMVGFVPPALVGAVLGVIGVPDVVLVLGLTIAGGFEGAAIGLAQARVLKRNATAIPGRAWVAATAVAASFAWFVGMGGGALMGATESPVLLLFLVPAWTLALASMGYLQWRVLRRSVQHSASWIPVTSGAWVLGVSIPVVAISATPDGWPGFTRVVVAVIAAIAMGFTVGALTGRTMYRFLTRAAAPS